MLRRIPDQWLAVLSCRLLLLLLLRSPLSRFAGERDVDVAALLACFAITALLFSMIHSAWLPFVSIACRKGLLCAYTASLLFFCTSLPRSSTIRRRKKGRRELPFFRPAGFTHDLFDPVPVLSSSCACLALSCIVYPVSRSVALHSSYVRLTSLDLQCH